jgi:hypothetical protein
MIPLRDPGAFVFRDGALCSLLVASRGSHTVQKQFLCVRQGNCPLMSAKNATAVAGMLFMRHGHDLLLFLTRRVGYQDAPDLLQETYLLVLRHAASETITEPDALLY